jgi:hypothetical protein
LNFNLENRAVCGIRGSTLIINFPGSKKAVVECFEAIQNIIPHAIQLIIDQKTETNAMHVEMQKRKSELPANLSIDDQERDSDTSSITSSTSGIISNAESMTTLFKRIDNINEKRAKLEKSLKPTESSDSSPSTIKQEHLPLKSVKREVKQDDFSDIDEFLKNSSRTMQEVS